jgi:precorrin-2 dehydrogenase/sirohydrochlorin ferrochelatase
VHRDGPLQIMVSTNGNGPKLANIVRRQIAAGLPKNIGTAVQQVGMLRKKLREVAPNIEEGPKRMQWYVEDDDAPWPTTNVHRMSKVCEQYTLNELCSMTEEDMEMLLGFYKPGTVPTLEQVRLQESDGAYDGPFLI